MLWNALNYGEVLTFEHHIVPVMLQSLLRLHVLGKHHQSRCIPVKAVHDENLIAWIAPLNILAQYGVSGAFLDVVGADREQSVAFVDHKDVVIFIYQTQTRIAEHMEGSSKIDLHRISL